MPKRHLPENEILKQLYESGLSPKGIAEKLSVNANTVASALKRIPGLKMRSSSESQKLTFANGRKPTAYWSGKKQPKKTIEKRISKIRGENHYLWKGGKSKRDYRDAIKKEICAHCGTSENLCIHHIDFDHYNNNLDNLQVLCLHCHLSLHKSEYWKSKRTGGTPRTSTAQHHWRKK